MAFRYAEDRRGGSDATLVSNNHFDQDGLVSMYALTNPAEAATRRELLIDVARAGDFETSTSLAAARISMTLSAYATPGRSPNFGLGGGLRRDDGAALRRDAAIAR
jgi:hypothetical protein